jgi:hypothetical protein
MYVLRDLTSCSGSTSPYVYDLLDHSLFESSGFGDRLAAASGDGSRIYACGDSSNVMQIFNSLTSTWSSSVVVGCNIDAISVSGNASRVILPNRLNTPPGLKVYGRSLTLLGGLPVRGVVLASWDSSRAFVFLEDTAGPRLEVYNLDVPRHTGGDYPLLKTVPVADSPNTPSGFHPPVVMTASRDDSVVFISGDARLLVVPVD